MNSDKKEIINLKAWKESAMSVLSEWDKVWEATGKVGKIGSSKSKSTLKYVLQSQWKYVHDEEPEPNREVIALSPEGFTHLTLWRSGYNIFCCQGKRDSSSQWRWIYVPDHS